MTTLFLRSAQLLNPICQALQSRLLSAGLAGSCLLGSCLLTSHSANAQDCKDLATRRAKDSCQVKAMRAQADAIIQDGVPFTKPQLKQLKKTASELNKWANKFLKPAVEVDAVAVRYFKNLVSVGNYFEWSNERIKAFKTYQQANLTLLPSSPLRAQAGIYAKNLDTRLQLLNLFYKNRPATTDPEEVLSIRASFATLSPGAGTDELKQQAKKQLKAARLIESRRMDIAVTGALLGGVGSTALADSSRTPMLSWPAPPVAGDA